ncbi:hypothetical protein KGF57_000197 [Candida theae]|uniref:Uncharacterized protein n=1 Tax=Candida theae TaxID=1198502 RepID=A0AAD5BKS0_9ASCO|nr:uncharacterized protein KGF57_000190 [Candida theae]XP_051611382.1 uncharacterized protein KGF57_000197 [Candida theae]KAI5968496.1 hypothetical protein KGF57_000190 [Candida theae]KAI5968503.1 hypothetical protein KGF57_000197 [Candida theae]
MRDKWRKKRVRRLKHPQLQARVAVATNGILAVIAFAQTLQLLFSNYYGPFKIKYSFGHPFSIRSVGIFQLVKLNLVVIELLLNVVLVVQFWNLALPSYPLIANVLLLGCVVLPLHIIEPTRSVVALAAPSLYWATQVISSLVDAVSNHSATQICLLLNAVLILVFEVGLYSPSVELKQYYELNDWNIDTVHNFWSEITFTWLDPTIRKIYETQTIDAEGTPPLHYEQNCVYTYEETLNKWNRAGNKKSLFKVYLSLYSKSLILMLVMEWIAIASNLGQAFLLQQFIAYFGSEVKQPPVLGLSIATAIFLCSVGKFTSMNRFAAIHFRIRSQVYSSLGTFVYRKAINLSAEARKNKNSGEVINNLAVDVTKISQLAMYAFVVNLPFRLMIGIWALYRLLGVSALFGLATALVLVPLSSKISASISGLVKRNMKIRDERLKLTSEILQSIKSIKLYAWEQPMLRRLFGIRNDRELVMAKRIGHFNAFSMFLWNTIPFAITITCLISFVKLTNISLIPSIIFPALSLFDFLTEPIMQLPDAIVAIVEATNCFARLDEFFAMKENKSKVVRESTPVVAGDVTVEVENATFSWDRDNVALSEISLAAKNGQLTCIVGKVGAGKSALIKAILGEVPISKGTVKVNGSIAYCAQQPWIQNATVRENILFGSEYSERFYNRVVSACQLAVDLEILPEGDATIVGEKGIALSGGQKARISLARAVYSKADIYLLDDVLSAVDAHVGKNIIRDVVRGMLAEKTVILATNAINVLRYAEEILLLDGGHVEERGSYKEVMESGLELARLINEHSSDLPHEDVVSSRRRSSVVSCASEEQVDKTKPDAREARARGHVKLSVYLEYFKACNFSMIILYVFIYAANVTCNIGANYILKYWSEVNLANGHNSAVSFYLTIYAAAGISGAACMLAAALIMWSYCVIRGSRYFHDKMANSVLRSPMQFFETTPIGRILNRFADDMNVVDQQLIWSILAVIDYGLLALGVLSLKRLVSTCRSPLFSHLSESVNGVETIRAYNQLGKFRQVNDEITNRFIRVHYTMLSCNRWLSMRLQAISAVILYSSALFILATSGTSHELSPGLVGFVLVNALSISNALSMIIRGWADIETRSVSLERVIEYCGLKPEAAVTKEYRPPTKWPSKGEISFENYSTKYREDLEPVLKNINFSIKSREKIGVVGRTGAGKSTLTMALFRIVEATSGHIVLDSEVTDELGLYDLRSSLNIIPQDSNVVEGTIRDNLDPLNKHTDQELWDVLRLAHLKDHVEQLVSVHGDEEKVGLGAMIYEGGSNLSSGQRQLLSLARALLNKSNVLILDEATASIDVETDRIVQSTIRSEFKDKTILTIAHRLETIADSDKVLVLDKGEVREFDSPDNLLKDAGSMYRALCVEGGMIKR